MTREERLHQIIDELDDTVQIIGHAYVDRMLFVENQLLELEKLPFIKVHPDDPTKQKELPARKQYIPLLQQYNLILKTILKLVGVDEEDDKTKEFREYLTLLSSKLRGE